MPPDLTLNAPERNRYFYGLLMDAERFQKDQSYFNAKRWMLNRFATGPGVLCGLALNYAAGALTLNPGIALDLAGREIVVPEVTPIDISQLTDAQGKATGPVPAGSTILISIAYTEERIDPVAVLVPDCDHPNGCAPSTVEESFVILVAIAPEPAPTVNPCVFGSFPFSMPPGAALQTLIANQVSAGYSAVPSNASIALGRLNLSTNSLDAVSDRPVVYDNLLLFQLISCLAARVSQVSGNSLVYASGDNQSASAVTALANPLVVALVDSGGNPVTTASASDFTVTVTSGGGSVGAVTAGANPGQFQFTWTLGPAGSGSQAVTVKASESNLTVMFQATIQP
jgi:hypothetical protein